MILAAPHRQLTRPSPREQKLASRPPTATSGQSLSPVSYTSTPSSRFYLAAGSETNTAHMQKPNPLYLPILISPACSLSHPVPLVPCFENMPHTGTSPCFASPHHSFPSINNPLLSYSCLGQNFSIAPSLPCSTFTPKRNGNGKHELCNVYGWVGIETVHEIS